MDAALNAMNTNPAESSQKLNLYDLGLPELTEKLSGWGEPAYRAKQLWEWLYQRKATSFDQMTSLPRTLREKLAVEMQMGTLDLVTEILDRMA